MSRISADQATYVLGSHAEERASRWVTPVLVEMVWERL
jgi:hypothetical protein